MRRFTTFALATLVSAMSAAENPPEDAPQKAPQQDAGAIHLKSEVLLTKLYDNIAYEEACEIMGGPGAKTDRRVLNGVKTETYLWLLQYARITATFQDGKLVGKNLSTWDPPPPPPDMPKEITVRDYNRIQEGMSLTEVQKIMGNRGIVARAESMYLESAHDVAGYLFKTIDGPALVVFADDQVIAKQLGFIEGVTPGYVATLDEFKRLQHGMSHQEVSVIIGSEGTETSSFKIGRDILTTYEWDGEGNVSKLTATFENGKLVSKHQYGLK